MALTLAAALGRPIEDIEDAVLAHIALPLVKHDRDENPQEVLDRMTNSEFLTYLALGFETLKELNQGA